MKVKDIQVDGFGVWTGLSVDSLPECMTLFYGPNEAGKTTLMQYMRAMLYVFTDDRREKYLPPVHGGTPGGAIRVTGPGGGYQVRRHSQLTDSGVTGQLSVTGQDGLSQGQHRLGMLLGQIDEPIFTNVFAIGMRELQELSTLDDTAAADELYKLSSGLDRVSLVDVLRALRGGRNGLVGRAGADDQAEASKLASLVAKRERLRDEVQQLTQGGRRWSELASQRRVQMQEIEQLTERMSAWERESRCVEVASGVFETWAERDNIVTRIEETRAEVHLPEDAPGQLVQIDAMMEDRRQKLAEVKRRRQGIRDKAEQLPVSRRMLDLKGRIEAATEQATWVEALEEQITRLDAQIDKAQKQLESDAERMGMDEEERYAIVEGDTTKLPDLSRQNLSALAAPSKQVKESTFLLNQARAEATGHKTRADKLGEELKETLARARATNLQQAIRQENETLTTLRHRIQVGDHLDKLKQHYRDLEKETVELTTSEALPVDRLILLAVPFIGGGMFVLYGVFHLLSVRWFVAEPDATWGMLCMIIGIMSLMTYYFGRENGQRSTSLDREDCERQIDTLRRQIREVEAERNDVDSTLPTSNESLEARIRESERLLADLDASLPTYHNHQAALQSYKTARDRAAAAAEAGKEAKRQWASTLERLGLSESLSPSSVRKLSDGYQTLQASRHRLGELQAEKDQRRRERQSIAKRIETLYLEALEVNQDADRQSREHAPGDDEDSRRSPQRPRTGPLEQLNHLHEDLSRQQHWIKRRRELKEQDQQLRRQQAAHQRSLERAEQQRRALWAKCGVATAEQFYEMVDNKASLAELQEQYQDLDNKVRSIIGTHVQYDEVAAEIEGVAAADLERRWESLTTRMTETETRVAQLRTQQGQLAQEMKHLADDNRLSAARLELGCVERQIESASRRWQTLATASCLLEDVCGTFERERQPETLREASTFLAQLTDQKYTRIWTPLGTNQLKIDDGEGRSLPLEVLSRGTREAVFIALRLSLAAAYARRGVMLPLVLDDVLVNFDRDRALHAARTLKTFAELGHQVLMFTCHDHIVDIFHDIDVEVRMMPPQGSPGRAELMPPEEEPFEEEYEEESEEELEPEVLEQEPEPEPEPVAITDPEPAEPETPPETKVIYVERPAEPAKAKKTPKPAPRPDVHETEPEYDEPPATIGWAWFERDPSERLDEVEEALASIDGEQWNDEFDPGRPDSVPDDVWHRNQSWWNRNQATGT
jgi:uncharacterized protein YhaN